MKLKSIDMIGFKSFANKTFLPFPKGLTEIIGPNGSGKSNIVEAIRWVLGEQIPSNLRGNKMSDVIFSGSKDKAPLNRAEVGITFDNSDGFLDTPFTEVRVARKIYRNGESEYNINNNLCRLKDISNLFVNTNLGKESLSIISQGNIDNILKDNNKSSNGRRQLVETVAGIAKYHQQKDETQKRIGQTDFNLNRISDIASEIAHNLDTLTQQKAKTEQYLSIKKEINKIQYKILVLKKDDLTVKFNNKQKLTKDLNKRLLTTKVNLEKFNQDNYLIKTNLTDLQHSLASLQDLLLSTTHQLSNLRNKINLNKQQSKFNQTKLAEKQASLIHIEQQVNNLLSKKEELEKKILSLNKTKLRNDKEQKLAETAQKKINDEINVFKNKLDKLKTQENNLNNKAINLDNQLTYSQHLLKQNSVNEQKVNTNESIWKEKVTALVNKQKELTNKNSNFNLERQELSEKLYLTNNTLQTLTKEVDELQSKWYQQVKKLQVATNKYEEVKKSLQINSIKNPATKVIIKNKKNLKGIVGTVGEYLTIDSKYLTAINTILNKQRDNIIVNDFNDAISTIRFLRKNNLGRVTFLPKNSLKRPYFSYKLKSDLEQVKGYLGRASELVHFPDDLSLIYEYLLGKTLVVDNLETAKYIKNIVKSTYRIVTLTGELVNAGGSVTGGINRYISSNNKQQILKEGKVIRDKEQINLNQMEKELEALKNKLGYQRQNQMVKQDSLNEIDTKISLNKRSLEILQEDLKTYQSQISKLNSDNKDNYDSFSLKNKIKISEQDKHTVLIELDEIKAKIPNIEQKLFKYQEEFDNLNHKIQDFREIKIINDNSQNNVREKVTDLSSQIKQLDQTKLTLKSSINYLKKQIESIEVKSDTLNQKKLLSLEEKVVELKNKIEKNQKSRTNSQSKLENIEKVIKNTEREQWKLENEIEKVNSVIKNIGHNLDDLNEKLKEKDSKISFTIDDINQQNINILMKRLNVLNKDLNDLGEINFKAINDFNEVQDHFNFIKKQQNDLMESKFQLNKMMEGIDNKVRKLFQETFSKLKYQFNSTFKEMFKGGEAKLVLTNPNNLLTTDIEIMVKPPGKRYRNINLLSGGERALTVLSLLFAVLKLKSVPFVILDEAESALDSLNATRLAEYITKLKHDNQFIVITHRKETMLYADSIYGVTMQDSGVSKVVSVDLDKTRY